VYLTAQMNSQNIENASAHESAVVATSSFYLRYASPSASSHTSHGQSLKAVSWSIPMCIHVV